MNPVDLIADRRKVLRKAREEMHEELDLENHHVRLAATFEDKEALFAAVGKRGLEGVVAKGLRDPYRPGERQWVKTKNRATARFAEERERVGRRHCAFELVAR